MRRTNIVFPSTPILSSYRYLVHVLTDYLARNSTIRNIYNNLCTKLVKFNRNKMKVLAIDVGYGSVKCCYTNSQGIKRYEKYISAVGKVGASSVVNDTNAFSFNGQMYYLFDTALKLPNDQLLDLQSYENLKEASPIIIAYLLKKYKVEYDRIVLGLSMAMVENSQDYLNYLSTNLQLPMNKFMLIPQGIGSKIAYDRYNRNPEDATQFNDVRVKNFLGVDIGFNTVDIYQCIGGVASGQTVSGLKGEGICRVAFDLMDEVRRNTGIEISIQHAKEILERGALVHRGATYDYTAQISEFIRRYFVNLVTLLESNFSKVIDNMDNILFVGGGAALLSKYKESIREDLERYYKGDFIMIPNMPEFYNVLGYHIAGESY